MKRISRHAHKTGSWYLLGVLLCQSRRKNTRAEHENVITTIITTVIHCQNVRTVLYHASKYKILTLFIWYLIGVVCCRVYFLNAVEFFNLFKVTCCKYTSNTYTGTILAGIERFLNSISRQQAVLFFPIV